MATITSLKVNGGGYITCIAVSPSSPNIVYASSDLGGIFRSSNYGGNWSIINKGLDTNADLSVTTICIDPKNPNIVYIGNGHMWSLEPGKYSGGIFKTINGGASWNLLTRDIPFSSCGAFDVQGRLIAVDPTNSSIVYAGSHKDGLFKSTDAGANWTYKGLASKYISTVVIDPKNTNTIYVSSQNAVGPTPGIYKSIDGGNNWTILTTAYNVYDLAIDAKNPQNLYIAAFDQGIYKSTNGGSSWTKKSPSGTSGYMFVSISVSPTNPQKIYTKTKSVNKVYMSTNGGDSWSPSQRLHADDWYFGTSKFGLSSSGITVDPQDEDKAYCGTWFSVWRSDNTGKDWTVRPKGLETSCAFDCTVDPSSPNVLYEAHADIGMFKSTNRGLTWVRMVPVGVNCWAIAIDMTTSPSTVYAGTGNWSGNTTNGKVFKSTNAGGSWSEITSGLSNSRVRTIAVDKANPLVLYAGLTEGTIYKSTNKGSSWTKRTSGLGTTEVLRIVIDPSNQNIVYAALKTSGIYKSINAGSSWTKICNGLGNTSTYDIAIDPNNTNILYTVCRNVGVYRSTNGGSSWTKVLEKYGGRSVAVDVNSIVYAGGMNHWASSTTSGLYRSENGVNFTRIDNGYLSQGIQHIEIDPTDTRNVYISTIGNGTFLVKMDSGSPPPQTPTPVPTYTPAPTITPTPVPGQYQYITKQAEEYVQINAPMIKVSHITSNGNFYVHCPSGHETGGYVKYNFSVAKSGIYKIAALVNADDMLHNSFKVVFDATSPTIWDIKPKSSWQWVHISNRGNGAELSPQYPIMHVNLSAGTHTLYIYDRNEQTKLKKLIITNNLNYVPGAPLPTEYAINLISNPPGAQVYIWNV